MVTLVNRAKVATATTGTGTITLGAAESGYQTFADAGVTDGDVVRYVIEDGTDWEIGTGTYTASGTTLTRTVDESSNSDAALNLSGSAVVYVSAAAEDIPPVLELYAENYDGTSTKPSATGSNGIALGRLAVASGNRSIAVGGGATATGLFSTALTNSYASGGDAFAAAISTGSSSYGATGANSVAIGQQAKATAQQSSAVGRVATATGSYSAAMGYVATASGLAGTAVGYNTVASGNSSTAIGREARATADAALAIGSGIFGAQINATGIGSTAIGMNSSSVGAQAITGAGAMALGGSYASGTDSFAAAIANNTSSYGATGANSVAIGRSAKATGQDGIAIGDTTTASGISSFALGNWAVASGTKSAVVGGDGNTASGSTSVAIGGYYAEARENNKVVFGGGYIGVSPATNIYQSGILPLAAATTDATPTVLRSDNLTAGTTNQVILPNNSAFAFHGTIVAREQASAGTDCAAWKIEGLIRREGSAGTTTLVNSATTVIDNTPSWGLALSADTTNGGLKIEVTGAAATNIRWVATVHTSEVTY